MRGGRAAVREGASGGRVAAVDLVKTYRQGGAEVRVLDGVTVSFESGRFTAITGASGSGKSTLLHCLAGVDTATSGRVLLGGRELSGLGERALTRVRRERVGFVFQAFNLLPQLSAERNITLPLDLAGRSVDRELFEHLVGVLGIGDRLGHRPGELSGGQQQRVALARALIGRPEVVFADEPTGNLDSRSGGEVLAFLRESVWELGQTVVMVTHDPVAASYADRVVSLADGKVVRDQDNVPTQRENSSLRWDGVVGERATGRRDGVVGGIPDGRRGGTAGGNPVGRRGWAPGSNPAGLGEGAPGGGSVARRDGAVGGNPAGRRDSAGAEWEDPGGFRDGGVAW
ncbi:ABC-type lipoprotein export system, ATPase component [Actinosynnema pretiosum]|nr:ABC-type lipoprotein export system, ATPase component [Actinosynnema pretiosum]